MIVRIASVQVAPKRTGLKRPGKGVAHGPWAHFALVGSPMHNACVLDRGDADSWQSCGYTELRR